MLNHYLRNSDNLKRLPEQKFFRPFPKKHSLLLYKIPDILADYKDLYEKNSDLVGWITIPDTNIDYPVMQGEDNSAYLNKNPYGEGLHEWLIFFNIVFKVSAQI